MLCVVFAGNLFSQTNEPSTAKQSFTAADFEPDTNSAVYKIQFEDEIVTAAGTVYKNVKIMDIKPDSILINCSTSNTIGFVQIYFADLPSDLQKFFQYNQSSAAEYEAQRNQQIAAQAAIDKARQDEARQEEIKKKLESDEANLKIAQQKYDAAKERYQQMVDAEKINTERRIADAQERQADALEQQNLQNEINNIDTSIRHEDDLLNQWQTQDALNRIDWDLRRNQP